MTPGLAHMYKMCPPQNQIPLVRAFLFSFLIKREKVEIIQLSSTDFAAYWMYLDYYSLDYEIFHRTTQKEHVKCRSALTAIQFCSKIHQYILLIMMWLFWIVFRYYIIFIHLFSNKCFISSPFKLIIYLKSTFLVLLMNISCLDFGLYNFWKSLCQH